MTKTDIKPGYKMTKLGWIPEEWEIVKIGDISLIDNSSLGSNTDPELEFKYISLSNVKNGIIDKELPEFRFSNAPSRARRILSEKDVLIATVRPNLKSFAHIDELLNLTIA